MFTGIVEEMGTVSRFSRAGATPLTIRCQTVLDGTRVGDSIAVDGVCLTVATLNRRSFTANVQPVTVRQSTLGRLRPGVPINLERSVAAGQRIGGHYVQGHVDGVARIVSRQGEGAAIVVRLVLPPALLPYVAERGYIAVDGASLTVAALRPDGVDVSLVYHTQQTITLPSKRPGEQVNIEVDVVAKYVERLLERGAERAPVGEGTGRFSDVKPHND